MSIKRLKEEELLKLKENEVVMRQLQSKNLQEILLNINNSENPDEQLEYYLSNNNHFDEFIQKVLIHLKLLNTE